MESKNFRKSFLILKKIIQLICEFYLVQEKIYFPYTFKETVLERLNEILVKDLKVEKQMKCYNCDEYNFRPKSFFSSIVTSKPMVFLKDI